MTVTRGSVDILMYHSIGNGAGPTCISADEFRRQLDAVGESGRQVATLASVAKNWPSKPTIVLSFDDGFQDFSDVVFPLLESHGWLATVFLPSGKVGGIADWPGAGDSAGRRLLDWSTVRVLAERGIEFGAHGVHHADLTMIPADEARREVIDSHSMIEEKLGRPVTSFAAPYGRTNRTVRGEIAECYAAAVGTELGTARFDSDRFDLPRLEMWYFRSPPRWQSYLAGARSYLRVRQTLRRVKRIVASF